MVQRVVTPMPTALPNAMPASFQTPWDANRAGLYNGALMFTPIAGYSRESGGRQINPWLLYTDPEQGGRTLLDQPTGVGHPAAEWYKRHLSETYGGRFSPTAYDAAVGSGYALREAAESAVDWAPPQAWQEEEARQKQAWQAEQQRLLGIQQQAWRDEQAQLDALPEPNQIVGRQYLQMSPDDQSFLLSGYEKAGFSGSDILNEIQRGLPQFSSPATLGTIRS